MRGTEKKQATMLTLLSPERCVPQKHPLRAVKALADAALRELSPVFDEMYSAIGRPSIPPERLLKSTLLMAFYSVRSETLFCEQLSYNLLFRWFLDMNMDEESFVQETFSKNRERLMKHNVASLFFGKVVEQARAAGLMSDEHFTVDGTLIEAWASHKSFRPKDEEPGTGNRNGEVNFHGETRSNDTHQSTTDPEARLYKKSKGSEAKLSYLGHGLMENRNGLLVKTRVTLAGGTAERDAALAMAKEMAGRKGLTLGGDKNYDTQDFVRALRSLQVTPHVAQNTTNRSSAIDRRTTRHAGYAVSQQKRKRVEQSFGWMKIIGMLRKVKLRGREKVGWLFTFVGAAYNLMRLQRLQAQAAA